MTTTSNVPVTPGTGDNVATYSFTEDGITKQLERGAINDPNGASLGGTITDAAATNFDATPISWTSIWKQISKSVQAMVTLLSGTVNVNIVGGGGSGGTSAVDASAFTEGTTPVTPISGEFNSSSTPLTTGHTGILRSLANRILMVALNDGAGTAITSTGGAIDINIKSGGGSGGTSAADAATFTEGTTQVTPVAGVFKTSQTALTTGQAGAVALTANRSLMSATMDGAGTPITSTFGALDINIKSGGGSGGTSIADAAAFTEGTTTITPMGGEFNSSSTPLTTGKIGALRLLASRILMIANFDGSGNAITSTGGALDINIKSGGGSGGTSMADEATLHGGDIQRHTNSRRVQDVAHLADVRSDWRSCVHRTSRNSRTVQVLGRHEHRNGARCFKWCCCDYGYGYCRNGSRRQHQ